MPTEIWLLGTAVVFTFLGMYFSRPNHLVVIEKVIDDLVKQGYIKNYKDRKGETELIKWWEDYPKEVDK